MKKLTNIVALEMVLSFKEVQANPELVEKLTTMKNQFAKKNNSESKPSKNQLLNNGIKETLLNILKGYDEPKMIKDLQSENEAISPTVYSNQKVSALLKQLVADGSVIRVEIKGKAHFEIA